ncbi:hypothetical protein Anas_09411 [Armadillidium nasatum]|uniref:Uncharacterized protein n=1 Tax=Armadillidium nasatum TaxID=96803 RepID=A0A5N5TKE5_9CRUS|nr:hypothetical protein Anas_09411 [Armadillidium nasatum]
MEKNNLTSSSDGDGKIIINEKACIQSSGGGEKSKNDAAKDMPSISPLDRKISSSEKNLNIPDDDSGESGLCNNAYEEEKEAPDENLDAYKIKEESNQESEKKDVEMAEESLLHEKGKFINMFWLANQFLEGTSNTVEGDIINNYKKKFKQSFEIRRMDPAFGDIYSIFLYTLLVFSVNKTGIVTLMQFFFDDKSCDISFSILLSLFRSQINHKAFFFKGLF